MKRAGQTDEALEIWNEILVAYPNFFVLLEITRLHIDCGHFDEARQTLEHATLLNDKDKSSTRGYQKNQYSANVKYVSELKAAIESQTTK